jgi:hypothetical protein
MKRVTARKKFTVKLRMFKEWLKKSRSLSTPELMRIAAAKLRGHIAYYTGSLITRKGYIDSLTR